jgi:hypothetical protein
MQIVKVDGAAEKTLRNPQFPLTLPVKTTTGETRLTVNFVVYYCATAKESLCYFKEYRLTVPVKVLQGAGNRKLTARCSIQL